MGLFGRLFKIGEANANALVDKLEDPVKMTEQAIRDLKVDLEKSIQALAEVKALAIRAKNETENYKNQAIDYESKAVALLQKAQSGGIDQAEADRLAQAALQKKEECSKSLATSLAGQKKYEESVAKLEAQVKKLKDNIASWENEAKILKARAKVSDATKSVNKQLAGIDSSSTVAMLERMKEKVEQQEALSDSYAEIANSNVTVDEEINKVLESSNSSSSEALNALKQKLALKGNDATDAK